MARQWVHPDIAFEVQQKFLEICTKSPNYGSGDTDKIFNIAKGVIEWKHRCAWVEFQHKHGLGVFAK